MKKFLRYLSVIFITWILMGAPTMQAQCPMCKAAVMSEHNGKESKLAKGLNTGILYMFVLPYLTGTALVILWVRANRKKRRAEALANANLSTSADA